MEASSSLKGHPIPPFLSKCYDMVEDQSTDSIISWSPNDPSFVIWDVIAFEQDLLPSYFKHSNFSSFIRQLNTYGFRKTNPDRWEFANDGFVKGQKHLLRNISRRKAPQSSQGSGQQKQPPQKNTSVGPCVEVGKFGLREEVEMLKSDKNVLMQELVKLRQHQKISESKLHCLRQRIQEMELHQQQMLSLLAMAVQSPGFLVQFLQQNVSNWHIAETSKKRPLPSLEQVVQDSEDVVPDGQIVRFQSLNNENTTQNFEGIVSDGQNQIVRYQSLKNENPESQDNPVSNMNTSQQSDPSLNELDDLFMNIDFTSFGDGVSLPMEQNMFLDNDGHFFLPESPEDILLERLLLDSPCFESIGNFESNPLGSLEDGIKMESDNALGGKPQGLESQNEQKGIEVGSTCNGTLFETTNTLDSLTKQMELLVSENNMS